MAINYSCLISLFLVFFVLYCIAFTFVLSDLWSYISVKIQFSNLECKHEIQNAECQFLNPEMLIHEVKIQFRNAESTPEVRIAVDKERQSCNSSLHEVKCARQKVRTRIWNVNALWPLKFWRGLAIATTHYLQISNAIQAHKGRKCPGEAKATCTLTLEGKSHTF